MAIQDLKVRISAEIGAFRRDMDAVAKAAEKAAEKTEKAGKKAEKAGTGYDKAGKSTATAGEKAETAGKKQEEAGNKAETAGKKAEKAGRQAESGMGRLAQTAERHQQAWDQVANTMVAAGAAIVGGLSLATKAAMDWETAWAGVTKTVDATDAQYAELEGGLRGLAKTLPATHAEIAGVAEAAGQLGVARKDILGFTKTMVDLQVSTNLTAEEAATQIAQISNVMGTLKRDGADGVARFGAALTALGNDGASTEKDILAMARRIAGAAATLGASESDVLALSNTLSSMGIRAELGGGVTTRVLLKMRKSVDEGGKAFEAFAKVAGLTNDEFKTMFQSAPMEALDLVSKGIHRVNEAGGNVVKTLRDMGIKGTEELQVMLALANSGDLLSDSLQLGARAWEENTALIDEATKRYDTANSRVRIAWNNIKDAAITAGADILPVVASIAESVADMANAWSQLPGPVKSALTLLGSVAGVALLAGGAFMKLGPKVLGTVSGLRDLAGALRKSDDGMGRHIKGASGSVGAMGKMEKAALGVAAAYVAISLAAAAASEARRGFDKDVDSSEITNALTDIAGKGDEAFEALDKVFNGAVVTGGGKGIGGAPTAVNDLNSAMDRLFNNTGFDRINDFFGTWIPGVESGSEVVRKAMSEMDTAIAGLASDGKFNDAAAGFKRVMEAATERGADVQEIIDMFPQYRDAAYEALTANGETQVSQERLIQAMLNGLPAGQAAASGLTQVSEGVNSLAMSAEDAAKQVDAFYDSLVNAGMVVLGEREALRALQESFDAAGAAAAENGKNLNTSTEKGRANQAALDGIASASLRAMDAQRQAGASTTEMAATIEAGREAFIKNATAMGMSEKAARKLADEIGLIPGNVYVAFNSNSDDLADKISEIHKLVQSTPDGSVTITDNSPEVRIALEKLGYIVTTLPDGKIKVSETGTDSTGKKIDKTAGKKRVAKITADAITGAAEAALDQAARDRRSTVFQTVAIHTRYTSSGESAVHRGGSGGQTGNYMGGRVGSYKFGGRLPYTGLGRDMIMGVSSDGRPIANVDDGEWVVRESSAEKYDRVLGMINRDDPAVQHLAAFANGGRVGRAEKKVSDLQKQIRRVPGNKKNRSRKADLQDQLQDARAELRDAKAAASAAKKSSKDAKKQSDEARKAEAERQGRLSDSRRELRTDLRRGNITDAFTSGSGLSQVDKLYEVSRNSDFSKSKRQAAAKDAAGLEKALASLTKRSEGLEKALEAAKSKAEELKAVRDAVANDLRGEFKLSDMITSDSRYAKDLLGSGLTAKGIANRASATAQRIERFAHRLNRLRDKGYGETIIQEVAALGSEDGMLAANALLNATTKERNSVIRAYNRLDSASNKAGKEVTLSMYRGGIDAAEGLVNGLQSKSRDVDNAFYKLGKQAEKAFRRSLDMHSPSRVLFAAGEDAGDGVVGGGLASIPKVEDTFALMGLAAERSFSPSLTVPPSVEVSRFAAAQGGQAAGIDYQKLASAMRGAGPVSLDARSIQALAQAVQPYLVMDNHVVAQANGVSNRRSTVNGKY